MRIWLLFFVWLAENGKHQNRQIHSLLTAEPGNYFLSFYYLQPWYIFRWTLRLDFNSCLWGVGVGGGGWGGGGSSGLGFPLKSSAGSE
jgi:hypothetical protein